MKMKTRAVCLMLFCGAVFTGGCAKQGLVKSEEPIVPKTAAASQNKAEQLKADSIKPASASNESKKAPIKQNVALEPIPNAGELKASMNAIYFDFDSYALSQNARDALKKNADVMKKEAKVNIRIEGNCDERGSDEYNLALGEKRAKAAMQYIVMLGVPEKRLSIISYGKEKPVALGHDEESWAKNRRDEFVTINK